MRRRGGGREPQAGASLEHPCLPHPWVCPTGGPSSSQLPQCPEGMRSATSPGPRPPQAVQFLRAARAWLLGGAAKGLSASGSTEPRQKKKGFLQADCFPIVGRPTKEEEWDGRGTLEAPLTPKGSAPPRPPYLVHAHAGVSPIGQASSAAGFAPRVHAEPSSPVRPAVPGAPLPVRGKAGQRGAAGARGRSP